MAKYKVAVMVGSLRKESFNRKLANALEKMGGERFDMEFLEIGSLPLYNQDLESDFPQEATRIKDSIRDADAILFVTPEYNRSVPGVMKNAIDWASRPYGDSAFAGKPAAVCGTSPGAIGTACAQQDFRSMMGYLDVPLMGAPEVYLQFKDGMIDGNGNVTSDDTREFLQGFVDKFAAWVEEHVDRTASGNAQQARRASA